jgi:hypothetical protein
MDSNTMNLHIFGELYTQNNVGIVNSSPTHTLSIGSNVYVDDTATSSSNVLYANGFGFFEGLRIGDSGLTVGDLITLDADAPIPMVVTSTIQSHSIQTTGASSSGISNTSPTDTLSIGNKLFINVTSGGNVLTVLGNTATQRLITESIRVQDFIEVEGESGISSAANVIIHGDIEGGDSVSNTVSIRCGPNTSNVSSIDIQGANTSASHQIIAFKTRSTERMRLAANGNLGIANTAPTEKLTIGGNLRVNGSNAVIAGTSTNYIRSATDTTGTQTKIESRVGTGKGLNFYASTTDTMGLPKMTILESSNVGIGTTTPKSLLHTSGGTVLINGPLQYTNSFNNAGTPMIVSNTTSISNSTLDLANVMHLSREGTSVRDGVRATFKMGKYDLEVGKSRSKLDIFLSDDRYTSETEVLTLRADGRVGVGHTQPTAHLEVKCTGISNPETNGLLVHNHVNGDAIMAAQADSLEGNAFTSYILSDGANRSGWSLGVANNNDFRITQNHERVTDSAAVAIYISDSDRNIGIGTDTPRAKLEVNGDVVIGNQLTFGGISGDEYGNCIIKEQLYSSANQGRTELLIFKGNERTGLGPDRIRMVAAEHVFETYPLVPGLSSENARNNIIEDNSSSDGFKSMVIAESGRVLIGTTDETGLTSDVKFFCNGGFAFPSGEKIKTGNMDVYSGLNDGAIDTINTSNLIISNYNTATDTYRENIRMTPQGLVGFGTSVPEANVHIYSNASGDIDVLKLQNPGTNNKIGLTLNTNDNYGGYVRGFSNSQYSVHGTVLGAVNNSTEADGIHIIHTSNVGIGTVNPSERFTVYNSVARLEHSTSNAIMEFKTTGGISNIYGDSTGNVVVDPTLDFIVKSNVEIFGDLQIDGKIDLGNQVAVDLGGSTANTALHVGGGFITGSNQVACKRYSNTFTIVTGGGQDVQLNFGAKTFYAKIIAQLRETSDPDNVSTMVLEVQGGTHDGSAPGVDIAIGTKNMFSGLNLYPWSPVVTTGKRSVAIQPLEKDQPNRNYAYDIFVEVVSGVGGALTSITNKLIGSTNLNDGNGGNVVRSSFTY